MSNFKMADSEDEEKSAEPVLIQSFLHLEEIDVDLFRGSHLFRPIGGRAVYGGQVVAHALKAAYRTSPPSHHVHSMHCYFLRAGNAEKPILYHVDHTREGRTYCNRNVKAIQNGAAIFTMQASFKKEESDPYTHQYTMPDVPGPENLLSNIEIMERQLTKDTVSEARKHYIKLKLTETVTYETRPVDVKHAYLEEPHDAKTCIWIRALDHIGEDQSMHDCVAAYLSDTILNVSLLPSAIYSKGNKVRFFMASLDHSVWFHNPFKIDEWMLYEMESPICGDGRGMTHGRLWKRDGTLAMSVAQEGVVRTSKL